jgi:hypothetical protein
MLVRFPILSFHFHKRLIMVSPPPTIGRVTRQSTRIASGTVVQAETHSTPVHRHKRKRTKTEDAGEDPVEPGSRLSPAEEVEVMVKRTRKKTAVGEEDYAFKPPRKKPEPKPEPVYVIPDVEKKETSFKGRLGRPSVVLCSS